MYAIIVSARVYNTLGMTYKTKAYQSYDSLLSSGFH